MAGWHKDPVRIVRSPSAPPASRFQWPQCSNMAAGVFPAPTVTWAPGPVGPVGPVVPILPLQLAQSNGHDVSELSSSLASLPRPSRRASWPKPCKSDRLFSVTPKHVCFQAMGIWMKESDCHVIIQLRLAGLMLRRKRGLHAACCLHQAGQLGRKELRGNRNSRVRQMPG